MNTTSWTPDNWIAFAAIFASVLVSLAGFFFSYFTNRANIKAKRAEIVTKKNVEAFRELVEILSGITNSINGLLDVTDPLIVNARVKEAAEKALELNTLHKKYRIYFPKSLNKDIHDLYLQWISQIARLQFLDSNEFVLDRESEWAKELIIFWGSSSTPERKSLTSMSEQETFNKFRDLIDETEKVIVRAQKYIGVETQEKLSWREKFARKLNR